MHTLEAVEICSAGMTWPACTGTAAITLEDIADAVKAANDDPHIQVPRGRLGHFSDLNDGMAQWQPFTAIGDAAPAFGRFVNLRTTNDGAVLVGDAIDVPDWINASSYPSRSMEAVSNVTTEGGKRYRMVVTAVAWLGAELPAVTDVEDLAALLEGGPAALTASKEARMAASALSVSATVIRDRFNCDWAESEPVAGINTYWWWARDVRVDPDEIIADDDEGGLWSVPFTTDGKDAVTFGEPAKVREDYVPVAASATAASSSAPASQRVLAAFTRPSKQDPPKAAVRPDTERKPMLESERKALATAHDLDPETATEAEVSTAVMEKAVAAATAEVPEPELAPAPAPEPEVETEKPAEAPVAPATVAVSEEVWQETQKRIADQDAKLADLLAKDAAREAVAASQRRDAKADGWVQSGRITPHERALARTNLDINEDATTKAYDALAAGRTPVAKPAVAVSVTTAEDELYAISCARMGFTPTTKAA